MHIFVQKQQPTQKSKHAKSERPSWAFSGEGCEICSILNLQRTIRNQTVQHLMQAKTEKSEADSVTPTTLPSLTHDFSRVPLYAKSLISIQSKPTVNTRGDIDEQEDERVAEQMMLMPEPAIKQSTSCPGSTCLNEEQDILQTKPVAEQIIPLLQRNEDILEDKEEAPVQRKAYYHSNVDHILFLQRVIGNQSVQSLLKQSKVKSQPLITKTPHQRIQLLTFGDNGQLPSRHQTIVQEAGQMAERVLAVWGTPDSFRRKWVRFWRTTGAQITPKPTFEQYRTAVSNRIIHDMDTSTESQVRQLRQGEQGMPLERQTAGVTPINSRNTYLRRFAIEQGVDSVVSLILHESMHGAGVPMGPLMLYEPWLHQFEADVGFPIMMGGADIIDVQQQRRGDYHVDVTIRYRLRIIEQGEPLPTNIDLQITDEYGTQVYDEQPGGNRVQARWRIPSRVGEGTLVWRARYPSFFRYSIRIIDSDNISLMGARRVEISPRCILGVSSVHCEGE